MTEYVWKVRRVWRKSSTSDQSLTKVRECLTNGCKSPHSLKKYCKRLTKVWAGPAKYRKVGQNRKQSKAMATFDMSDEREEKLETPGKVWQSLKNLEIWKRLPKPQMCGIICKYLNMCRTVQECLEISGNLDTSRKFWKWKVRACVGMPEHYES